MPCDGSLTLFDVRGPTLAIHCAPCDRRGHFDVSSLVVEYGADAKLADLLAVLVGTCPKAHSASVHERCRAVYEGLSD
jgi:hypothetical protein